MAERPSDELFTVDTAGDSAISKKFPKHTSKKLKTDEIIEARSAVPAVSLRKRPGDKTSDGIAPTKRPRREYVTQKELKHLQKVADGQHETTVEMTDAAYDPWSVQPKPKVVDELHDKRDDKKKAPNTMAQNPISLLASGKSLPAVQTPSGGFSYNPDFDDYNTRYTEESRKTEEAEKKRLQEEEAARLKAEAAARSGAEAEAAEARAELSEWDEDSEWEGFQSGGEDLKTRTKRPGRKTPAARNRANRRKEEERRQKHAAKTSIRKAQLEEIHQMAKDQKNQALAAVSQEAAESEASDSSADGDEETLRRRQLGKFKLPEKDLELVLPDELQDSLRRLKPEGNLLKDRYRSMVVRGRLEARRRIPYKKQAKKKATEKWTYKDFSI